MDAPIPRPLPIVLGGPHDDDNVAVVLRVIERGQDDVYLQHIIGRGWKDKLSHVLDYMIREMRMWVGVRHGTWICHVVPIDWRYDSPSQTPVPSHRCGAAAAGTPRLAHDMGRHEAGLFA